MAKGAGIGALWGAASDDTSVLGGAAMGALGGFAFPSARAGLSALNKGGGLRSAGRAVASQLKSDGIAASRYIGNTAKRGYNSFRGFTGGYGKNIRGF